MNKTIISPQAIVALKHALSVIYWYKNNLREYLTYAVKFPEILSTIDWSDTKRNIVARVIDIMVRNGDRTKENLLEIIYHVNNFNDFSHLAILTDGSQKVTDAKNAIIRLRNLSSNYFQNKAECEAIEKRKKDMLEMLGRTNETLQTLAKLKIDFFALSIMEDAQAKGYKLEKFLNELFDLYDLDAKHSFKIIGEQIDGAFSFNHDEYLLEAKWRKALTGIEDLDAFSAKLQRKLDNTLGLFISITGFSKDAVTAHSSGRKLVILMDGTDLMAVLENRIGLLDLLKIKKRKAAQTGEIYVSAEKLFI